MIYLTFIISISSMETEYLTSRTERDTFNEREKLVSTYKIVSKTQCLLQMRSFDGYVYAKHITNLYDSKETNNGIFLFFPIAVNLFLIQHKESKRYLCGRDNQLFGLFQRNERECLFETKRSDIDFGHWDSYRLFYENSNHGYLSISHTCYTRLRRKYSNDNHLDFLAFVRINTDISIKHKSYTNLKSSKFINNYRQLFIKYFIAYINKPTCRQKRTRCS
ncbi:unnamed protein product [Rotaria sp. Silwood1]|nr:unnamed protein product [Rotaria sp. Silwood1]CAF1498380.1 unnamed protein product [Rotaria sp. Silwood1]CAF1560515.1 unnamed protein product [Rotaria sp. Silwood1]CAF3651705.1 unnamed protein product [Rotaria sp. Silwood1]CAF3652463.1 unnamed protein product [Rotaria sp. Silwood1]